MADGAGIRLGSDARVRATLLNGDRELDLTNRTVTVEGRLSNSSLSFSVLTAIFDEENGAVDLFISGSDIADPDADSVAFEFTITGTPQVNPNEKPLVIPLRPAFAEADR